MRKGDSRRLIIEAALSSVALLMVGWSVFAASRKPDPGGVPQGPPVLWRNPVDIEKRNLFYGPGGETHRPPSVFKFIEEDMAGSSPKFELTGADGSKWKAKLGIEVHPEVAASRLLWAAGYFANEDYFVSSIRVEDLPHLRRGSKYVQGDSTVTDVRLKRHVPEEKKIGIWSWKQNPFTGTREWNGLRVMMAVMNNWDLKDVNNSIYQVRTPVPEQHYVVSDLGASFGSTNLNRGGKGSLDEFKRSHWISRMEEGYIDFNVPSDPGFVWAFDVPEMTRRRSLVWIGRHIRVDDAKWLGSILARLSQQQLRDAFLAGGYSPAEAQEFARLVGMRIRELNDL